MFPLAGMLAMPMVVSHALRWGWRRAGGIGQSGPSICETCSRVLTGFAPWPIAGVIAGRGRCPCREVVIPRSIVLIELGAAPFGLLVGMAAGSVLDLACLFGLCWACAVAVQVDEAICEIPIRASASIGFFGAVMTAAAGPAAVSDLVLRLLVAAVLLGATWRIGRDTSGMGEDRFGLGDVWMALGVTVWLADSEQIIAGLILCAATRLAMRVLRGGTDQPSALAFAIPALAVAIASRI